MKFPTEDTPPRNNLYLQSVTLEDIATIYLSIQSLWLQTN